MAKDFKDRLIFQVARIPDDGLEFGEDLPREWLVNIPEFCQDSGAHIEGPIRVSGRIRMDGDNLRLKGRVSAELVTVCTRCGEDMRVVIEGELDATLIKGNEPEADDDLELTPEDMEKMYYDGVEVDLAPFFQEEFAVQVPIQTLCKPDCGGLCSRCGANLNVESCACEQEEGDPRLAVLRSLKIED